MRIILISLLSLLTLTITAQKKAGDYIESVNNNVDQSRAPRSLQYIPKDGAFYCLNGKNRFTRALYGSHSDYRIETSDFPIFAIYKSKNYRSLRFVAKVNGTAVELDKVERCEAWYKDGMRSYLLSDKRWGANARLRLELVALPETEGAVWKFEADGFDGAVAIESRICEIANKKLHRNGDMGADKPGVFEPSPTEEGLVTAEISFVKEAYAQLDFMTLQLVNADNKAKNEYKNVQQLFEGARTHFAALASRVQFSTPDKLLNALGGALVLAADGVWDGETWLHGAIGWRMPLAGWRAGYLGDVLGWNDRAVSHFDAYAASQVTDVPVTYPGARQDSALSLARAEKKWGTEMYSTGYICRNPNKNNQMHHYDMNLNYVDELLWHFQYDADTAYMRKMWPVLKRHLAWEKLNFDSDNDHLYDAYCCIWASDALYYSDGAVTHSSAYNYRGNLLAAKIARMIGEDAAPYQAEADAIRRAMNDRLWVKGINPHWAEYQESMHGKRVHPDAAVWSVYTPIDCGVGNAEQMFSATRYVTEQIPHIPVLVRNANGNGIDDVLNMRLISTSDWMPYSWSINNVASAEIMHTALSYFEAGNAKEGYQLMQSNLWDQMLLGQSPANFGQINYYDAARGECYRDFGDNVGISSRTILQGFFGIVPQALDGKCIIRPGFPLEWDSCEVRTPYLYYKYKRIESGRKAVLHVEQNFSRPLSIELRINGFRGNYHSFAGTDAASQDFVFDVEDILNDNMRKELNLMADSEMAEANAYEVIPEAVALGLSYPMLDAKEVKRLRPQNIRKMFNAEVDDIFNQEYLSPRPASTTLQIPKQGVGEWCHPQFKPEINDSVFRTLVVKDRFDVNGIAFDTPKEGNNIVFTSLWDNYPSSVTIPVKAQKASEAYLLLAGSTNHMQCRMDNAVITANYADGTSDTLRLIPPYNYCPIEQDYFVDGMAFTTIPERPLRVSFGTGVVSTDLGTALRISPTEVYGREVEGGAGQMLRMPLTSSKKVTSFTLTTVAPDVVVGLMGITLR